MLLSSHANTSFAIGKLRHPGSGGHRGRHRGGRVRDRHRGDRDRPREHLLQHFQISCEQLLEIATRETYLFQQRSAQVSAPDDSEDSSRPEGHIRDTSACEGKMWAIARTFKRAVQDFKRVGSTKNPHMEENVTCIGLDGKLACA